MSLDYYELLNITTDCDQEKMEQAYKKAVQTYSPENGASQIVFSKEETELILQMIDEAYAVLSNEDLKKLYDRLSESGVATPEQLSLQALTYVYNAELDLRKKFEKPSYTPNESIETKFKNITDWSGAVLKEYREYKNMSLEYLNYRTKINTWYLKAIEEMDLSHLPAPVFIRGYVIQLAKELGLNEKAVTDSYMSLLLKHKNGSK